MTSRFRVPNWSSVQGISSKALVCGFCGNQVAAQTGWRANGGESVAVCPHCKCPTFFGFDLASGNFLQVPEALPGSSVANLPPELASLYDEARKSAGAGAYTASVMVSRKMLMNIAVVHGAKEGESFVKYVEYLANQGYIPPNGKAWVDHIRQKGNEANHEIALMTSQEAFLLVRLLEQLLRNIYEFPSLIPAATP